MMLEVDLSRAGVALVTLNRPEKRNALSIGCRLALIDAFDRLGDDESVGAIVLTGAGSAFCSGMDFTQFGGDGANREALVTSSIGAFESLRQCSRPVIAAVNGPALAGGFALALLCDVRIAARQARLGYPELGRGIPPAYAALRSVVAPALAAELCLSGRVLEASEALALGVVSEVCPDDGVERALELAQVVAARPRWAVLETKRRILLDRERAFGHLFADEAQAFRAAMVERQP